MIETRKELGQADILSGSPQVNLVLNSHRRSAAVLLAPERSKRMGRVTTLLPNLLASASQAWRTGTPAPSALPTGLPLLEGNRMHEREPLPPMARWISVHPVYRQPYHLGAEADGRGGPSPSSLRNFPNGINGLGHTLAGTRLDMHNPEKRGGCPAGMRQVAIGFEFSNIFHGSWCHMGAR